MITNSSKNPVLTQYVSPRIIEQPLGGRLTQTGFALLLADDIFIEVGVQAVRCVSLT